MATLITKKKKTVELRGLLSNFDDDYRVAYLKLNLNIQRIINTEQHVINNNTNQEPGN